MREEPDPYHPGMMPTVTHDCDDLKLEVGYLDVVTLPDDWTVGWPDLWFDEVLETTVSADDLPEKMSADGSAMFWSMKVWSSYYQVPF